MHVCLNWKAARGRLVSTALCRHEPSGSASVAPNHPTPLRPPSTHRHPRPQHTVTPTAHTCARAFSRIVRVRFWPGCPSFRLCGSARPTTCTQQPGRVGKRYLLRLRQPCGSLAAAALVFSLKHACTPQGPAPRHGPTAAPPAESNQQCSTAGTARRAPHRGDDLVLRHAAVAAAAAVGAPPLECDAPLGDLGVAGGDEHGVGGAAWWCGNALECKCE